MADVLRIYRFYGCGQRFYVSARSLVEAYRLVLSFDPFVTQKDPFKCRCVFYKAQLRLLIRTVRKSAVWDYLKGDGPDPFGPFAVSPFRVFEMYRHYHSICPCYTETGRGAE